MEEAKSSMPEKDITGIGHKRKRRWIAFLLSAFVLPGMGQLYLGQKVKGVAIIFIINLLMLLALFVLVKGLGPAITVKIATGTVDQKDVLAGLNGAAGFGKLILAAFMLVWCFAGLDIFRNRQ